MTSDTVLQDILAGLSSVVGFTGACLLDRQGNVIAHRLPPPYEPVLVSGAVAQLGVVLEMYGALESNAVPRSFCGRFESGVLLVRWNDPHMVVVLGTRSLNTAMLTVALNAVSMKLAQPRAAPAPELSSPMVHSVPPNRPAASQPQMSTIPPISTGVPALSRVPTPSKPAKGGVLPVEVLREMVTMLARSVGPLAQGVLKREVQKLGCETREFPRERGMALVEACAAAISDPAGKKAFLASARKLVE